MIKNIPIWHFDFAIISWHHVDLGRTFRYLKSPDLYFSMTECCLRICIVIIDIFYLNHYNLSSNLNTKKISTYFEKTMPAFGKIFYHFRPINGHANRGHHLVWSETMKYDWFFFSKFLIWILYRHVTTQNDHEIDTNLIE